MSRNPCIFTAPFIWRFQLPKWPFQRHDGAVSLLSPSLNRDCTLANPLSFKVLIVTIWFHNPLVVGFFVCFSQIIIYFLFYFSSLLFTLSPFFFLSFFRWKLQTLILKLIFSQDMSWKICRYVENLHCWILIFPHHFLLLGFFMIYTFLYFSYSFPVTFLFFNLKHIFCIQHTVRSFKKILVQHSLSFNWNLSSL